MLTTESIRHAFCVDRCFSYQFSSCLHVDHAPACTHPAQHPLTNCNIEAVTSSPGAPSFPGQKAELLDDDRRQKVPPPNETRQVSQLRARFHGCQPSPSAGSPPLDYELQTPFPSIASLGSILAAASHSVLFCYQELLKFLDAYTRMNLQPDAVLPPLSLSPIHCSVTPHV